MSEDDRPRAAPRDPFGLVGTLLERKYRVDRAVAEGGFGVVYAGHHLGLDAAIAVKALRSSREQGEDAWTDALHQFLLEAKTLARLRSPAVVTVYDAGVTHLAGSPNGVPWLVLEWIDGETLHDHLAERRGRGGRSPAECIELVRAVLAAIAEAHENGIAHRDLKPSNVMLERTRRGPAARVLDFGIAKIMEREEEPVTTGNTATDARHRAFSPAYAAPEQVSGMRTGPWTDVHALGLLLTELLVDRAPYRMENPNDLYRSVFDPVRPTPALHGVDVGAWEAVIAKALAIKPAERFASAGELLAALDDALAVGSTRHAVRPSIVPPRAVRPPGEAATLPSSAHAGRVTERSGLNVEAETAEPMPPAAPRAWRRSAAIGTMALGLAAAGTAALLSTRPRATHVTPAPVAPRCTTNAACTAENGGKASVCRKDKGCVALESADCVVHADGRAKEADDTVWVGTIFPTTGPDAADIGTPNTQAAELARRDFADIMGGTAAAESIKAPPFGLLACDDSVDPHRAAKHMVDVGVQAVIGFTSGPEAIDLMTSYFIPNGVLSMSATCTNPMLTTVPHPPGAPRLIWRTAYNTVETAAMMSAFVPQVVEPQIRGERGFGRRPIRVALVRPKNTPAAAFSKEIFARLRFNGKTALANGDDFRELTYASEGPEGYDELRRLADELLVFAPQVVLFTGGDSLVERALEPIERGWSDATRPRPRYVSTSTFGAGLLRLAASPERRKRVFGTSQLSTTPVNARFVAHYNETFPDHWSLTDSPNTSYDAFYVIAYAAYASAGPVTGASLSRGIARVRGPGRKVDVGLADVFAGFSALRAGESIDLSGSSGELDFDPATGDAQLDEAVLCAAVDEHGRPVEGVESGLVYRTGRGTLEGALRCP